MLQKIKETAYKFKDREVRPEFLLHLGDFELRGGEPGSRWSRGGHRTGGKGADHQGISSQVMVRLMAQVVRKKKKERGGRIEEGTSRKNKEMRPGA